MRLLGIRILKESFPILKILQPGWFPFGHFKEPAGNTIIRIKKWPKEIEDIYSTPGYPHIVISAIVGQNGAGKSTLLEILYKILNNFAVKITAGTDIKGANLEYAMHIYADLYYIVDGLQYKISCRGDKVYFYKELDGRLVLKNISPDNVREILGSFFYTIITNYSLYAFNTIIRDSTILNDKFLSSKWLDGLFHKNDGYFTPIVITPYREDGNIDVISESWLAESRVNAMSLLAEAKGKFFIPGYRPSKIYTSFDKEYLNSRIKSLSEEFKHSYVEWLSPDKMMFAFTRAWENYLRSIGIILQDISDEQISTAIDYLAYKSLKLSLRYSDYRNTMKYEKRKHEIEVGVIQEYEYYTSISVEDCGNLIRKIFSDICTASKGNEKIEHNHLTLKIEQTLEFITKSLGSDYVLDSKSKIFNMLGEADVKTFLEAETIENYTDIYRILPPPFFHVQLEFELVNENEDTSWQSFKQQKLTLDSMSSGERHLLNCLSYVLYHIKNIEGIVEDANRIKYRNVLMVFDEIELYFHPEYQRKFIKMMLEALDWCNVSVKAIHSIQIILVTHSPFILTDIFSHNTMYLKSGKICDVENETFGANYYDLLNNSFFFTDSAFGDVATKFVSGLAKKPSSQKVKRLIRYIGDRVIVNYLKQLSEKGLK